MTRGTLLPMICLGCCFLMTGTVVAETFVLQDDEIIEGKITRSTNNTILIMLENGAIVPASLAEIKEVRIHTSENDQIVGRLISWENGIYEVVSTKYTTRIANGEILSLDEFTGGFGGPVDEVGPSVRSTEPTKALQPEDAPTVKQTIQNATM